MQFYISRNYVPETGKTVNLLLQRSTDNFYYNGSAWASGIPGTTLVASGYDPTNYPGLYEYDYTPTFSGNIYAKVYYTDSLDTVRTTMHTFVVNDVTINDIEADISSVQNTSNTIVTNVATVQAAIDDIEVSGVIAQISGVIIKNDKFLKIHYFNS